MIHQPIGNSQGQASDMEIATRHILKVQRNIYNILAQRCGKPYDMIKHDCDRDCYLSAEDALAYGIVDKIV